MQETFISGLSEDNLKLLIIFGCVFGSGIITTLMVQIRKYLCYRQELEFKRELLDRGASVDEIERLVKVRGNSTVKGKENDEETRLELRFARDAKGFPEAAPRGQRQGEVALQSQ